MRATGVGTKRIEEPARLPGTLAITSQRERQRFRQLLLACDATLALVSLGLALGIRSQLPWLHGTVEFPSVILCGAFAVALLFVAGVHRRITPHYSELHVIASSSVATLAIFLLPLFSIRRIGTEISRPTLVSFIACFIVCVAVAHECAAQWQRASKTRRPPAIVIVGDPELSAYFAREVTAPPAWNVVEIIPDDGITATGMAAAIERSIRIHSLDAVVLVPSYRAPEAGAAQVHQAVMQVCEATGTKLQVYANWLGDYCRVSLDHLGAVPVLGFDFGPDALSWTLLVKRGLDLSLAATLLVMFAPVMALTALAIKLDSPGPVLFKQARAGHNGRPFVIYKFRTMVADAEQRKADLLVRNEISGPTFKMDRDPRLTRIGRSLRKSSIDELPQLWNVVRGEMSLVGPRPHPVEEARAYATSHIRRLSMKPGITGLWQVSGRTSILNFDRWVELDVTYIQEWSLWLDFRILARTCGAVMRMTGH